MAQKEWEMNLNQEYRQWKKDNGIPVFRGKTFIEFNPSTREVYKSKNIDHIIFNGKITIIHNWYEKLLMRIFKRCFFCENKAKRIMKNYEKIN